MKLKNAAESPSRLMSTPISIRGDLAHLDVEERQERPAEHHPGDHDDAHEHAQDHVAIAQHGEVADVGARSAGGCGRRPALRLAHVAGDQQRHHESRDAREEERGAPAPVLRRWAPAAAARGRSRECCCRSSASRPCCARAGQDPTHCATSDWHTGRNGPSARPMSSRAANSAAKEPASPERNEHSEKATTLASRIGFAPAGTVRERTAEERRDRPGEGERRGNQADLLVAEAEVRDDERHHEAGGIAVEEQEPEGDAEYPDQTLFVAHSVLTDPCTG